MDKDREISFLGFNLLVYKSMSTADYTGTHVQYDIHVGPEVQYAPHYRVSMLKRV